MPAASETRKCPTCQKMPYIIVEGRICYAKSVADSTPGLFHAPSWWYKFLLNASSALHARPVGREATRPDIVAPALRQANRKCQYATICSETECTFLKAAESLAKKVDELTNEVRVGHSLFLYQLFIWLSLFIRLDCQRNVHGGKRSRRLILSGYMLL